MTIPEDPSQPMFPMPSILVWFGLVDMEVRLIHVARSMPCTTGSVLVWYYCAASPVTGVSWFGGSIGVNIRL
jgi:hypothetical protein